jgi:hypothetical protein
MSKQKLNELVFSYQRSRTDEDFEKLLNEVYIAKGSTVNWKEITVVAKSVRASESEIIASYEDTLLNCIKYYDGRGDFVNLLNRSIWKKRRDIYLNKKRLSEFEVFASPVENDDGSEPASFEIADDFNLEEQITAKKKADQRQLIDSLLNGADETTTAIVATFLAHPKPTATAIAKELGVHHSKVTRALNRLASKFSTKQFGDYHDYLIAL